MRLSEDMLSAPCDITTLDNELLATGKVRQITEKYIEIANDGETMPEIDSNILVKLIIHNKNYSVYAATVYLSSEDHIQLASLEDFADFEKREYFRVNVSLDTRGYYYTGSGEPPYDVKKPFRIHIVDLSLRGVLFSTKSKLTPDQQIAVLLPLNELEIYSCKVKRIIDFKGINGYGCEFVGNSNKQENLLCNYIFEEQRKVILKKKYGPKE